MRTIGILAASTVLAAVGGTTAAFAYTSTQADGAGGDARIERSAAQPASFVRPAGRVVRMSARDGHRSRHVEPGDDHGRHAEPGDDHGRDDHGRHGGHGSDD